MKKGSDARLYGGLGGLVVVLAALVWWSLPGDHAGPTPDPLEHDAGTDDDPNATPESARQPSHWERPSRASAEFAIVTDRPDDVVQKLAAPSEIASRLDARHCGDACDAVKKFVGDEDSFELEVMKTEEVILPPRDSMDTVAPGLTPGERDKVQSNPTSVMVRTQGAPTREQLPARAAFAAAALLADALDGFVYDEVSRRIETARDFGRHMITAKLGEPAFAPRQIVVQFYRDDEGTARLMTLGMQRYGSPDLSLRGANMSSGPTLASVLNAAASKMAYGHEPTRGTIEITLDDVARTIGQKPADLNDRPASAQPVELALTTPERTAGDPDNELVELAPKGGASREGWDAVLTSLFGGAPSIAVPIDDKELDEVAKKARRELPDAIVRFQNGSGELFVKGPFTIPSEARVDGGAASELLWVAVSSCDDQRCTGVLTNEPTHATNLAAGRITTVRRGEIADWMLQSKDGTTLGGASIKILKTRGTKKRP